MELQVKSIHETNFLIGATYCEIAMDGTYGPGTYHGVLTSMACQIRIKKVRAVTLLRNFNE